MVSKATPIFAVGIAVSSLISNQAMAQDLYGLGINVIEACDLRPNGESKMSDKCYGIIGAVVEIEKTDQFVFGSRKTCIPDGLKVEEIYKAIRPILIDIRACFGPCTSTGSVISALARAYPCKG